MIYLVPITIITLCVNQWLIYFYAPVEESMGLAQKIFYLHLPLSWLALLSFLLVFLLSIAYLAKRTLNFDLWALAFAELGVLFASLALLTGMIWGRTSWGVWWTWDPRLVTTLVMWFIYFAYLQIAHLELTASRKRLIRAITGIIAFLDVPLVFISARIFRSIHPAVFGSASGGLEPEMKITVMACIFGMSLLWLVLAILRKKQLQQKQECMMRELARLNGDEIESGSNWQ